MAEFTFGLRYDSIPAAVVAAARRHLADTLACALGAHNAAPVLALQKSILAKGGRGDATIIGTAEKVPAARPRWLTAPWFAIWTATTSSS